MSIIITPIEQQSTHHPVETIHQEQPLSSTPASTAAPVATPVPDQKPDEMSAKFAALARKERMIRDERRKIEEERKSLKDKEAEITQKIHAEWKSNLSKNPWDTLVDQVGLTPDQLTQVILNPPKPEDLEIRKLKQELEELKGLQNKSLEEIKNQQQTNYQSAKNQMALDVDRLVKSDPERYPSISNHGKEGKDEVVQLIEYVFQKGLKRENGDHYPKGYILSVEEAADEIENAIFQHTIDQYEKLSKIKKYQDRLGVSPKTGEMKTPIPQKQNTMNTLSNRSTPTVRTLTDKERRENAIAVFNGQPRVY